MNDTITLLTGFINDRMKQKLSDSNIKLIITDLVTCIDILLNRLSNVENSMNDLSTLHNKHIAKYDKNARFSESRSTDTLSNNESENIMKLKK